MLEQYKEEVYED